MIHSFLTIGRPNMAGRGCLGDFPPLENKRLFMLRNGRQPPLSEPVNYGRPFAGTSPAAGFADEYSRHFNRGTGLIPRAGGETGFENLGEGRRKYFPPVNKAPAEIAASRKELDRRYFEKYLERCNE